VWHVGARVCVGVRPEGRSAPRGEVRCAERKEVGASLANVRAGKVRGGGFGVGVEVGGSGLSVIVAGVNVGVCCLTEAIGELDFLGGYR